MRRNEFSSSGSRSSLALSWICSQKSISAPAQTNGQACLLARTRVSLDEGQAWHQGGYFSLTSWAMGYYPTWVFGLPSQPNGSGCRAQVSLGGPADARSPLVRPPMEPGVDGVRGLLKVPTPL